MRPCRSTSAISPSRAAPSSASVLARIAPTVLVGVDLDCAAALEAHPEAA